MPFEPQILGKSSLMTFMASYKLIAHQQDTGAGLECHGNLIFSLFCANDVASFQRHCKSCNSFLSLCGPSASLMGLP